MFCRFCGNNVPDDSTFCPSCGKAVAAAKPIATTAGGAAAAPAPVPTAVPSQESTNKGRTLIIGGVAAAILLIAVFALLVSKSNKTAGQQVQTHSTNASAQSPQTTAVKPTPAPLPELTTEDLFKLAAPSVVLLEVFNDSGLRSGTGSGFVASDGTVVTNYHVIRGAYSANVHLQDGTTIPVQGVAGYDQGRDVAVVRVSNLSAKPLALGDSQKLQIGDKVVAIGSPLAIQNTISDGLVSGIRNGVIQTSTPISPGSSGGPLFNTHGEVVGITVATMLNAQNINFAVPIDWAKGFLKSSGLTSLSDLAKQNTVEQPIMEFTIAVPPHDRRLFPIIIDRNRMANPVLDGSFSSQGGLDGNIRVMVVSQTGVVYDSGRTTTGNLRVPLPAGAYELVLDNTISPMFGRSVTGDIKLHYVR